MILDPYASRQRRAHVIKNVKEVYQKFLSWKWEELVCLDDSLAAKSTKETKRPVVQLLYCLCVVESYQGPL